jgi:nucleoside-triphosphatase THEP1
MIKVLGRRVLITGDVGAGKTRLTRRFLEEAKERGLYGITVIDMAPKAVNVNGTYVGGALVELAESCIKFLSSDDIKTPRLSASTAEELLRLADHNMLEVEELLRTFETEPSNTLFVNDVSIYLQRGDLERLWRTFQRAETVIANGYVGEMLEEDLSTGLSRNERRQMELLALRMDEVIRL